MVRRGYSDSGAIATNCISNDCFSYNKEDSQTFAMELDRLALWHAEHRLWSLIFIFHGRIDFMRLLSMQRIKQNFRIAEFTKNDYTYIFTSRKLMNYHLAHPRMCAQWWKRYANTSCGMPLSQLPHQQIFGGANISISWYEEQSVWRQL